MSNLQTSDATTQNAAKQQITNRDGRVLLDCLSGEPQSEQEPTGSSNPSMNEAISQKHEVSSRSAGGVEHSAAGYTNEGRLPSNFASSATGLQSSTQPSSPYPLQGANAVATTSATLILPQQQQQQQHQPPQQQHQQQQPQHHQHPGFVRSGHLPALPMHACGATAFFPQISHSHAASALSAHYHPAAHAQSSTPQILAVLKNRSLRKGKWIPEEEEYAELLINLFEQGHLTDCENGATLRIYLSQKLHCAPMRISKKYAGRGIGKMVFVSKTIAGLNSAEERKSKSKPKDTSALDKEREKNAALVKKAEEKFHKAVSRMASDFFIAPNYDPAGSVSLIPGLNPLLRASAFPFPVTPACHLGFVQQAAGDNIGSVGAVRQQRQRHPKMAANACVGSIGSYPSSSTPSRLASAIVPGGREEQRSSDTVVTKQTEELRQSFLNALNQANGNTCEVPASTQTALLASDVSGNKSDIATAGGECQEAMAKSSEEANPARKSMPLPDTKTQRKDEAETRTKSPDSSADTKNSDIPDFLSAFDSVALSMKSTDLPLPGGGNQKPLDSTGGAISHTVHNETSRSFEDFHRFHDKDMSSPEGKTVQVRVVGTNCSKAAATDPKSQVAREGGAKRSSNPAATTSGRLAPEAATLFTAESYAMFAQESAIAASQHAAYQPWRGTLLQGPFVAGAGSFDIEGMVQLVSQQVVGSQKERCPESSALSSLATATPSAGKPPSQVRADKPRHERLAQKIGENKAGRDLRGDKSLDERLRRDVNFVSGSEPSNSATETDSNAFDSLRGSSESNGSENVSNESEEYTTDSDNSSNDSGDSTCHIEGPQRKKARILTDS